MKNFIVQTLNFIWFASLLILLPVIPVMLALMFFDIKYLVQYAATIRRSVRHIKAMLRQQSMRHYLERVLEPKDDSVAEIGGSCVRCGNCCLEKSCLFLEQDGKGAFLCGIYNSLWRRYSNCGAYPISQRDIDRYACPSYFVIKTIPIKAVFEPASSR